jgi:hypothetical protein
MGKTSMIRTTTRATLGLPLALGLCSIFASLTATGCAEESASGGQHVRVIQNPETAAPTGGIPPDKQAEVQLLLEQRNPSTLKCYSDVLNEKHTREFKGNVIVVLTLEPSGENSKASKVDIIGGSMTDKEVTSCLVDKLKEFDYPKIESAGSMQYVYRFEPAY